MRRLAQLRTSCPAVRIHLSASRIYSTEHGDVDATTPTRLGEVEPATSTADEPDLDALFNFGDKSSAIDHQNKTVKTAVGSLPISPLLDPAWRKAREPRKKKQPRPFEKMLRFQKRTKQNPYAQLLAEPVRNCHVTRARLPRPFLQGFGLVTHPETDELWWMPAGFEEPSREATAKAPDEDEAQTTNEDEIVPGNKPASSQIVPSDESETTVAAAEQAGTTAVVQDNPPAKKNGTFWAPAHVLARQDLLKEFLDKKSKHSGGQFRFAMIPSIGKLVGKATWRQDMHEVLRERMRRGIVDDLIEVSKTCENGDRVYLVHIHTPQDSLSYQNQNCFLLLAGEYKPFDYLEVPGVAGSARPVYHLPELLGAEQMKRLRSASLLFGENSLSQESAMVLLKGKANIEINKKLWRLQGFVADYANLK